MFNFVTKSDFDHYIFDLYICVATQRKGPYVGNIKIEFCIACSRGHSACHFGTQIMYPCVHVAAQILPELLRIWSFKTCIMKN